MVRCLCVFCLHFVFIRFSVEFFCCCCCFVSFIVWIIFCMQAGHGGLFFSRRNMSNEWDTMIFILAAGTPDKVINVQSAKNFKFCKSMEMERDRVNSETDRDSPSKHESNAQFNIALNPEFNINTLSNNETNKLKLFIFFLSFFDMIFVHRRHHFHHRGWYVCVFFVICSLCLCYFIFQIRESFVTKRTHSPCLGNNNKDRFILPFGILFIFLLFGRVTWQAPWNIEPYSFQ